MTLQECKEKVAKEMKLDQFLGISVDVNTIDNLDFWNAVAELYATSRYDEVMKDICQNDQPWPLQDVLQKLIWGTNYLLGRKNYDGHGHEELRMAAKRGVEFHKELLKKLKK